MKPVYFLEGDDNLPVVTAYLMPDVLEDQAGYLINDLRVARGVAKGQGLGTKLLIQLCAEADAEGATLRLGVSPSEPGYFKRLVRFYRRHGFVPAHRTMGYVHNVMIRRPK